MKIKKISITNFKIFDTIEFEVENINILIWPNNSGKTTILQALWLWNIWRINILENERTFLNPKKKERFGLWINIQSLSALPVKIANELFKDQLVIKNKQNIKIQIRLDFEDDVNWSSELIFYFSNTKDSIRCNIWENCFFDWKIIWNEDFETKKILFEKMKSIKLAYLQPMTAISKDEEKVENWAIYNRLASWNTAWVLRNVCYKLYNEKNDKREVLKKLIKDSFVVNLSDPLYNENFGTIELYAWTEKNKKNQIYQLGSLWRWCLQSILLYAFILDNEDAVVLLDEPDAHLEMFKQKWIYNQINQMCKENSSQIFLATHSESIMNEAIDDNIIWVWANNTHNLVNQHNKKNFSKILSEFGVEKYYNCQKYWHIIFLEWNTDKKILVEFAKKLWLDNLIDKVENKNEVYFDYAGDNVVEKFKKQFYAFKEVVWPNLQWLAIYDKNPEKEQIEEEQNPNILFWAKREIENYFFKEYVILDWLKDRINNANWNNQTLFFNQNTIENILSDMKKAIQKQTKPVDYENRNKWSFDNQKASEYLENFFSEFLSYNPKEYRKYIIEKKDFFEFVKFIKTEDIDKEIITKLNKIEKIIFGKSDLQ